MTPDINSRARQLLADIGLKESAGDPPEIAAQYDMLADRVTEHLGQVAAEARETTNPFNKIFDHRWLSPECVETGCKSLLLARRAELAEELADKYKWQVRDTCTRAEKAESALAEATKERDELKAGLEVSEAVNKTKTLLLASLRATLVEAGEALKPFTAAYDRMTPDQKERAHTHFLGVTADFRRAAFTLASIQSALREIPTSGAKPLDFP